MRDVFSLIELNGMVREALERAMPDDYWVEAELSEVREGHGHCFLELIQKDGSTNTPLARASARCWRTEWRILRPHFERITGQRLAPGMKVLMLVRAQFHESYGFSWIVRDIDPTFTLGDMARKRRDIIRKLKEEGVFDLNKELPLPMFAQRIAVISSATAAGFGDFSHQLSHNECGFRFTVELFPAVMQGEKTESSVIAALNEINRRADGFDCVAIIRGGGATSDLSGFDTLALAENVANFPLPVIIGIGHERDESVLDMVANTSVKTPTAAAEFLVNNLRRVSDRMDTAQRRIRDMAAARLQVERMRLERLRSAIPVMSTLFGERQHTVLSALSERLRTAVGQTTACAAHRLDMLSHSLAPAAERILSQAGHRLEMLSQRSASVDPVHLLRRGYSITLHNGRALTDVAKVCPGDEIVTRVANGSVQSTVILKEHGSAQAPLTITSPKSIGNHLINDKTPAT